MQRMRAFTLAIAFNQTNLRLAMQSMKHLLAHRRYSEAVELGNRLLQHAPDDAALRVLLAAALAQIGSFDDALLHVEQVLKLTPEAPWTWRLMHVNLLRDSGRSEAALQQAQNLRYANPNNPAVHNAVGLLLKARAEYNAALAAFQAAYRLDPAYRLAYINAAAVLRSVGDLASSIQEAKMGLTANPGDVELTLLVASLCEQAGRQQDAQALYTQVLSCGTTAAASGYKGLARLAYARADLLSAIDMYEKAVDIDSSDWTIWNAIGNCHLDLGQLEQAGRAYRRAMRLEPDLPGLHDNLLLCHLYDPGVAPEEMYAEHAAWEVKFAPVQMRVAQAPKGGSMSKHKIGFISHALNRGPTGFFLAPLVKHLDRSKYTLHAYSVGEVVDEITDLLRGSFDTWSVGAR